MMRHSSMPLAPGTRLGPYEVLAPLGAGGMGEVYRGRDTRLDRTVAIKLILAHVAADPQFRERFDREAKAISALDHPHICTLYDVGHERLQAAGATDPGLEVDFLVMQYLEGETLADRLSRTSRPTSAPNAPPSGNASTITTVSTISRGPIPLDMTLRYAGEIAHALDAAHRRGIVHRDLKPGNVMLTKSGTKLLDFGLAKLADQTPVSGFGDATRTSPLTGHGALLGTLHYMSPEQLEGRNVDARSDIFAFGALLFEMLSGQRAFDSQSQAGVIAAIIGADPPPLGELADVKTRLPVVAHRGLDRLLRKCLAKNPDDRWQSGADLADELKWIDEERLRGVVETNVPATPPAAVAVSRTRERGWMAATALAVLGAAGLTVWLYPRPAPLPEPIRFFVNPPDTAPFADGPGLMSVSPDGQRVAFVTGLTGTDNKLWIRPLGSLTATALPNTEGAWHPAWSPDGRSIAFTGSGGPAKLRKVDVLGGAVLTLAELAHERPAWSSQGIILFTGADSRLYRVGEGGGPSTPVTELDKERREVQHAWPVFLPDGRRFVYSAQSSDAAKSALYLASLDSPTRTRLVDVLSNVDIAPGYLIYQRDGTLMAHPFDEKTGRVIGDAVPIVEDIQHNSGNGRGAFSVSRAGVLVYRTGEQTGGDRRLTWFDRTGKTLTTVGDPGNYSDASLSPDGHRLAVVERDGQGLHADLWLFDLERGIPLRFTSDADDEYAPVWSPDGATIVFTSDRKGPGDLYQRASGGATPEQVLYESPEFKTPTGFSPDGKLLLFTAGMRSSRSIWALPMTGEPKPVRVFPGSTTSDGGAVFSPDGHWIAYTSSDSGGRLSNNVYVQSFPANGIRTRISTTTSISASWTADGKRIVYDTDDNRYMAVDVTTTGGALRAGLPKELFVRRRAGRYGGFVMDAKGERFLLPVSPSQQQAAAVPLTVVVNWATGLVKK